MNDPDIHAVVRLLREDLRSRDLPIVTCLAERQKRDPFIILISTLLSLRTKDDVTAQASRRLFNLATTPSEMLRLSAEQVEKAIYPVGFYRNKARTILQVCAILQDRFGGIVPDILETLLSLPGVGRKTANLVLTLGYLKDGICVDTHVHRISNRLGYVCTKNPEETEFALRKKLPQPYWYEINTLLVAFGQNICHPLSPRCSLCSLRPFCNRIGVTRSR